MATPDPIALDTAARATRCAIWISLVEAQRAGWPDVLERLYALHADVDARVRRGDLDTWRARLDAEGPSQADAHE